MRRSLRFRFYLFGCLLLLALAGKGQYIDRIEGGPYPASRKPDTLFVIDDLKLSPQQQFVVQSLQGLLARYRPKIFRISDEGSLMWQSELTGRYGVRMDNSYANDYVGLVNRFKDSIAGYILCSTNNASANAAVSLSSIYNAITVPDSLEGDFAFLKKIMDVRSWTEQDVYAKHHGDLSKKTLAYQKRGNFNYLGDYSVFTGSFQFFEPLDNIFTQQVFKDMNDNSALFGWGNSERDLVSAASKNSIMVHASDFANNLSALTNINTNFDQQGSGMELDSTNPKIHTVCFLMTDGDNIQWLTHDFATSKKWYNADVRGTIPLGWTVSPALCELAPPILKYLYDNAGNSATGRDYFVAAPSGLGYMYPEVYPQMTSYGELLNKYMKKADLNIVNVIGNPRNVDMSGYTVCSNIDAVFYYMYSDYSGWRGKIIWSNNKPVIGGKFNFWGDKETPQTLADKINNEVKNQYQPEGYSLIPVRAWTHTVEDVKHCIDLLGENVRVVAPDDFVKLIKQNLSVELFQNFPNPFNDHTTISFKVPFAQPVSVQILDGSGDVVKTVFEGNADAGITKLDLIKEGILTTGSYICVLVTPSQTKTIKIEVY